MRTRISLVLILMIVAGICYGQKFSTKSGIIQFVSTTPNEDVHAKTQKAFVTFDQNNGKLTYEIQVNTFEFSKAQQKTDFNTLYVQSEKFPDSEFKGKILRVKEINFGKGNVYKIEIEGNLTIRGVTKKIKQSGTLQVKGGNVIIKSKFMIKLADFEIPVPKPRIGSIAENVEVTMEFTLDKI